MRNDSSHAFRGFSMYAQTRTGASLSHSGCVYCTGGILLEMCLPKFRDSVSHSGEMLSPIVETLLADVVMLYFLLERYCHLFGRYCLLLWRHFQAESFSWCGKTISYWKILSLIWEILSTILGDTSRRIPPTIHRMHRFVERERESPPSSPVFTKILLHL